MTKSELIAKLQNKFKYLPIEDVRKAVQIMLDRMGKSMSTNGHKVEIRRFGSFGSRLLPPRGIRNPKTGEKLHMHAKPVPFFKAAANLRNMVNYKSNESKSEYPESDF